MRKDEGSPGAGHRGPSRLERALGRAFAWHLLLYPRRFRTTFGEEMKQVFFLRVAEIVSLRRGAPGRFIALAGLVIRTGLDGIRAALSERLRSSFPTNGGKPRLPHPVPPSRGRGTTIGARMDSIIQDIRFGFRALRRRPLFALVAIVTLGLGIGSAASVFSVVDGVLVRPLPYADPGTLVSVSETRRSSQDAEETEIVGNGLPFTWQDYLLLRDGVTLMDVAVFTGAAEMPLTGAGAPEQLSVGHASANLFDLLGVLFPLGRGFLPGEDAVVPGQAARLAVLSQELWQRRFGSDPDLLGSTITLDQIPYTVVGILPSGFRLQSEIVTVVVGGTDLGLRDVWVPIGQAGSRLQSDGNAFEVLGRLAPGVGLTQARAEADAILAAAPGESPMAARLTPRQEVVTRGFVAPILVMFAGAGLLLMIACANVATLMVSEATERRHEIATRSALGAGRWRLSRQLLTESVLLGFMGSLVGILVALAGTEALLSLAPPIPRLEEVEVSARVLGFAIATGVLTGVIFGLAPLALLARSPVGEVLARRFRGSSEGGATFQGGAVAFQFALTVVLLVVGGLFARSLVEVRDVDPGFLPGHVATLRVSAPSSRYPTQAEISRFFEQVVAELESVPGVESVAGSYGLPFPGGAPRNALVIGRPGSDVRVAARRRTVLPGYHETLGISLVAGRTLSRTDQADRPGAMVISESLARRYWEGQSPIGATVGFWGAQWTIVGIVGDVRHTDLFSQGEPTFYVPFAQAPRRNLNLVVRTAGNPAQAIPLLGEAVWRIDPDMPLTEVSTLPTLMDESLAEARYRTILILVLGALASIVAAVGIFGLTARSVARRSRELGVRMALGADCGRLVAGTLWHGLRLATTGMVMGLFAAVGIGRVVSHLLFGVRAADPLTYGTVAGGLLLVCAAATLLPAMRVTRLTPMTVLREE